MEDKYYSLSSARAMHSVDASQFIGHKASAFWLEWDHPGESAKSFSSIIYGLRDLHWPRLIKPGATCIDIGAHSGDTTIPIGMFCFDGANSKKGNVFAVEPNPDLHHLLDSCFAINAHISNFELVRAAITSTDVDEVELADHDNANCNGGIIGDYSPGLTKLLRERQAHTYKARGLSLESLIKQIELKTGSYSVDFIKIDCEGYDKEILKGGANLFRQLKPALFIEWFAWFEPSDDLDLFAAIDDIDYVPLHPIDLHRMTSSSERTGDLTCIHRSRLHELCP
jgi:FkbM family methyltransferase